MSNHRDDSDDDRKDLTQIGDLPEFLHAEDPELDSMFADLQEENTQADATESSELFSLDQLEEESDFPPEVPPEIPSEIMNEASFEIHGISEEENVDFSPHTLEDETSTETNDEAENTELASFENVSNEDLFNEPISSNDDDVKEDDFQYEEAAPLVDETPLSPPEDFADVKSFAQNFSYGTIDGAGNPPFSVVVRNIKYNEDAEDILSLLKEFGIVNESNLKENEQALKMGAILISQISEFTAIILAHKLRRYDLDIEVGLSDIIHPSKSGEQNPRGLTNKDHLKQNRIENVKVHPQLNSSSDILVSNTHHIDNYTIIKNCGIDHAHTFIDEDELDRLTFIEQNLREKSSSTDDERVYLKYKDSFHQLHNILIDELKSKAMKEGINALLNVQFTLNSFAHATKKHQYQLTCTCTKAIIAKE